MNNILQKSPLDVFNLSQNYDWNQLKQSFKTLAIHTHPDKGGDKQVFNHVTNCFKILAKKLKYKENNKTHQELKELHKYDEPTAYTKPNINSNNFNSQFNKIFTENHFVDEDSEFGYGNEMDKSTSIRKDFKIQNIFDKKNISNETFNQTFDKIVPSSSVIKYTEPEAMYSIKNIHYTELGKKTEDYSGKSGNIQYTDYRIAHSESRIPTTDNKRKQFKSIKEYQQYSDKFIKKEPTKHEINHQLKKENKEKMLEEQRLKNIEERDNKILQHYQKISKLFLT